MSLSGGRPFKSPPPTRFFFVSCLRAVFPSFTFPFPCPSLRCNSSLRSAAGEEEGEKGKAVPSSSRSPKNQRPGKRGGGGRGRGEKLCNFFPWGKLDPLLFLPARTSNEPTLFLAFVPLTPPLGAEGKGPRDYWSRDFFISRRERKPSFILERCQRPPPPPATQPASLRRPWQ